MAAAEIQRPAQSPSSLYLRSLRHGDVVQVGAVPAGAPIIDLPTPRAYGGPPSSPVARGAFALLPWAADQPLSQDWSDPQSFAGLVAGERWVFGVPYHQGTNAATAARPLNAPNARALFVAYSPPSDAVFGRAPALTLDNGAELPVSGQPAVAWRAWPPIYLQCVLLDYTLVPSGRRAAAVQPGGTRVMGVTAYTGEAEALARVTNAFAANSQQFREEIRARDRLLALRAQFATLPAGKIAILPGATAGAGANFLNLTGLQAKAIQLTEAQLIDTNQFNPTRFPLALYLNGERYVKTVNQAGDGKTAVTHYLAGGGALALLASGPFPFYYGDGPAGQQGGADPLLPQLGLPIVVSFEQPPTPLQMRLAPGQTVVQSVPSVFPFPPGDSRLRAVDRARVNAAHQYTSLIRVESLPGQQYGDAGGHILFRTGPASTGQALYLWSTLLAGPQGNLIMADAMSWLVQATVR
jgi:hypothetical protein